MQSSADSNPAGMAQAFSYTATASGTTADIDLYVVSGTTATKVVVGVYSDSGGKPGSLLASGSIPSPQAGSWNDVPVGQTALTQGTTYWLALLPTGGQLNYFDAAGQAGAAPSYVEANSGLTSLPTSYASGHEWNASPASFYVNGQTGPKNTALPTVSGTAQQGNTLTTSNGSWTGTPTSYAYQWQDCNSQGASCSNISGATSSSYRLTSGDVAHTTRSVVIATNAGGSASATSNQTAPVAASGSVLVGNQQVQSSADSNPAGMAQAFSYTATASGTTADIDLYVVSGTTATKVVVGVYSDSGGKPGSLLASGSIPSPQAGSWNDVPVGQTALTQGTTYWLALLPTGGQLNYFDAAGQAGAAPSYVEANSGLTSLPTSYASGHEWNASPASFYVNGQTGPKNTALPTVSGTAQQGNTLTTSNGSWTGTPTSYAYQWQDCNSQGASCSNISGATSSTHVLTSGDVGHTMRSVVTACNNACGTASSAPSGVVASSQGSSDAPVNSVQPYFVVSSVSNTTGACTAGCAIEGQQLSVTPGIWSHNPTFSYQWQDCIARAGTDTRVAVATGGASDIMTPPTIGSCVNATGPGATTTTYTVSASDVGHALAVNVTATNGIASASTTPTGSCDTGLMTTTWNASTNPGSPIASTYFDDGQPGCSPISAVVGTGQYGAGTAGEHFCTNAPITCGFADIANSGVPRGTALYAVPGTCTSPSGPGAGCGATGSGWSYSGGRITLSAGAVLQNVKYVGTNGSITVSGSTSNVTIQDSDLSESCNCNFQTAGGIITLSGSGGHITIQRNNLHGLDASKAGDGCNAAIFAGDSTGTNITVAGNDIYFCSTGLNQIKAPTGGWAIIGNYIHDLAWADSARSNHFDGIQFEGGGSSSSPTAFVNNTDLCDVDQTDAIILSDDFSPPANSYRSIVHNLVGGGDFALYVSGSTSYPTTKSTFASNVFSQIYMGDHNTRSQFGSGSFGPTAYWTPSSNTWTGNVWDDTGGTVPPSTQT